MCHGETTGSNPGLITNKYLKGDKMELYKVAEIIQEVALVNPGKRHVQYLKRAFNSYLHGNIFNGTVLQGVNRILQQNKSTVSISDQDHETILINIGDTA